MAELKTKPTRASVEAFLKRVANKTAQEDAFRLLEMMQQITGELPKMWGPSMVGFGTYHYVYASGHEGDIFLTGFSPRKGALALYFCMGGMQERFAAQLKKLGKVKASKGCLYIKKLADVDLTVLRDMIRSNVAELQKSSQSAPAKTRRKKKK